MEGAKDLQLMGLGQPFGALQDPAVLAADQDQSLIVVEGHQFSHEFDAVHLRHLQIAEDQRDPGGVGLHLGQGGTGAGVGRYLGVGKVCQLTLQ